MYITYDGTNSQVEMALAYGYSDEPLIELSVTSPAGATNTALLDATRARELASHILARCDEAAAVAAGSPMAIAATRAESGLIGTIVRRIDDDAPVPQAGIVTGTWLDTEGDLTCYVAWGCYTLDEVSAAVPEWHDALTPVDPAAMPAPEFARLITDLRQAVSDYQASGARPAAVKVPATTGPALTPRQAAGREFAAWLLAEYFGVQS